MLCSKVVAIFADHKGSTGSIMNWMYKSDTDGFFSTTVVDISSDISHNSIHCFMTGYVV